jgi:hypothetical protein
VCVCVRWLCGRLCAKVERNARGAQHRVLGFQAESSTIESDFFFYYFDMFLLNICAHREFDFEDCCRIPIQQCMTDSDCCDCGTSSPVREIKNTRTRIQMCSLTLDIVPGRTNICYATTGRHTRAKEMEG